jgi:hypothetical protein
MMKTDKNEYLCGNILLFGPQMMAVELNMNKKWEGTNPANWKPQCNWNFQKT